jgi:hypothetical protein
MEYNTIQQEVGTASKAKYTSYAESHPNLLLLR